MHAGIDCRLPFYQVGGISAYAVNLVQALAELNSGHQYTIFHSRKDRQSYVPERMPDFRRADLWTPCHYRLERWTLGVEVVRHRLDLLHSPDFIPPSFGARRRIITVHDLNFLMYPEFLTAESRRYYNDQIGWAVKSADHILADSHHTRLDLIERLSVQPEKITTVQLASAAIYADDHSPDDISATLTQLSLDPGYILFVGTLSPRKNVKTVLEALELLDSETSLDARLVLAGSQGWLADDLFAALANSPLKDRITHLSGMSDLQMAHLYSAAGLLVMPSFYEGFGLPVLEAMHCRCPVIASNRSSLPEVVGQAGILVDPTDTTSWAEAIRHLLEDETERQRLIHLGIEQARRFSWRKTAEETLAVYEKVCVHERP